MVFLGLTLAAGCSSSSSGGQAPSASGSTAPGSAGSSEPAPTHTSSPKVVGPAGGKAQVTAPTTVAPTKGATAGSEVFPHIAPSRRKDLQSTIGKLAGVQTVTYYTNFKQLQVYWVKGVTAAQKAAVVHAVTGG
jgi:hypothetical protein